MKASIRIKIMGALFLIALLTFVPMFYLAYIGMKRFIFTSTSIGDTFAKQISVENNTELNRYCLGFLQRSTIDHAHIFQLQLEQAADAVNDAVAELQNGKHIASCNARWLLSSEPMPEQTDKYAVASSAPGTSVRWYSPKVRKQLNYYACFLQELQKSSPLIKDVLLICNNGIQIAYPGIRIPNTFNGKETVWFKNAIAAKENLIWSEFLPESANGNEPVLVCARAWLNTKGSVNGVIAAEVPLHRLTKQIESVCKEENAFYLLMDSQGRVIAGNESSITEPQHKILWEKIKAKQTGSCRLEQENQDNMLVCFAPIRNTAYHLVICLTEKRLRIDIEAMTNKYNKNMNVSKNLFLDYVKNMVPLFGILASILLCFVLGLGYFLAKQLTRPIYVLAKKAAHMGDGHLSSRLHIHTGDEVEVMANALNRMADNLTAYIRNMNQAARERQRVESELKAAAEIQKSMLPTELPQQKDIELFAFMKPAREVGGDMYDFTMLDENRLFFMIGDVSGKGIPAALFMASAKTLMHGCALSGMSPAEILLTTNNSLAEKNDSCMFITAFCGIYDRSSGLLVYANAGHNPPLHHIPGSHCEYLDLPAGFPLGPLPQTKDVYKENTMYLLPGESLFIYTDGATEALNKDMEIFGKDRLKATVDLYISLSAEECITKTVETVFAYMKDLPQSDDLTVMMLREKEDFDEEEQ